MKGTQDYSSEQIERAGQVWRAYAYAASGRLKKPTTHAAATEYAFSKAMGLSVTQKKLSSRYRVSSNAISVTYKKIWSKLALQPGDPRLTASSPFPGSTHAPATTSEQTPARRGRRGRGWHGRREQTPMRRDQAAHEQLMAVATPEEVSELIWWFYQHKSSARPVIDAWATRHGLEARAADPQVLLDNLIATPSAATARALYESGNLAPSAYAEALEPLVTSEASGELSRTITQLLDAGAASFLAELWVRYAEQLFDELRPSALERLGEALVAEHALTAIEVLEEVIGDHLDRGNTQRYARAAQLIDGALRRAYDAAKISAGWDDFLSMIVAEFRRKPAFVAEFRQRGLMA